jgi:peptide/nickel transport system substrate-binding protein
MRSRRFGRVTRRNCRSLPCGAGVCLAIALAGISGCAAPPPEPSRIDTLRLGSRNTVEARAVLTNFLFAERLVAIDWNGRPNGVLATGWQWRDDGRTLEVQLRQGVTFHDGTPLTAEVVADILRQVKQHDRRQSFAAVTLFEALDDHTLAVRLSRPDAFLVEAIADTWMVDPTKPDIGTGPFKLLTRTPSIKAEKNAAYYRGMPGIDKVEVITYDTQRAAWVAMMRGEVDMVQEVNRDSAEFLEGASHVDMSSTIRPYYIPLIFNVRHPILRRVEVRRALAEAINRDEIVEQAMRGHGRVADDPVWPFHWAYNAAARKYTHNPNAARLRMDAAGLPMRPPPASGGMASRFSIHCVFWNDPQFERIALLLQRQLAEVGIDLVLEGADEREVQRRAGSGEFDTYLYQLASGKSFDWTYRFWHSPADGGGYQNSGYTGVDSVLERLRTVRPDTEIRTAVADLRERFYEDVPAAFLAWPETTRAIDARFDVGEQSGPDIFANVWKWRPAEGQRAAR